jgi:rubrerythrin
MLLEKLLLEESNFEDNIEPEITDDNLDKVVADAQGEEPPIEPTTTTYKVTFNLGKHTNWSRIDATNEEDAKQQVADYVTKKWPNRGFEVVEVEEFNEEEMEESLNEAVAPSDYKPNKVGKAYKVFKVKNGKLYPPMVANPGGADTPIGVWLTADEGEFAGLSKTGRPQVKSTGSGTLSYRPGWHLGDIPRASQFDRTNKETGEKEFPKDFVWAECEYTMDVDYQPESDEQGYMRMGKDGKPYRSDKYQHSLAGLPKLPKDGYYKYRTNPRPDTVPWVITGAIKVNKLLSDDEVNAILEKHGIAPIHRQGGDKTLSELGLHESLKEDLGEITDAQPIEDGACVGMASVISDLIKDEYEAIDGYNSAIATAEAEGFGDMVNVLTEIQAEEQLHIGQLQAIMNTLDPNAHLVDDGQQEGIEQLSNPLSGNEVVEESLIEDLDDMSNQDQDMFIRCVNEIWDMSVMEWTQKYYAGQLEVTTVGSYGEIPDTSNLIEIGSSDLSQGTGNVIVYTYMDAGDGTLYRYADF